VVQCQTNRNALHIACEHGHLDVAEILMQNGADIDLVDNVIATYLYMLYYLFTVGLVFSKG
jgi:ankyrin repeat protein